MFAFAAPRSRRKPALTPLIDVVFLLLVFFMLAAQFGREGALDLATAGSDAAAYDGPPRLVQILPEAVLLNGRPLTEETLPQALDALTRDRADIIVLRPDAGADVQRLTDLAQRLSDAGFTRLVVVE
jgi:biopolymer transport protein ExbD